MPLAPFQTVPAPTRTGLPYGLFSVINFRTGGDRWENGVNFEALTCAWAQGIGQFVCREPIPGTGQFSVQQMGHRIDVTSLPAATGGTFTFVYGPRVNPDPAVQSFEGIGGVATVLFRSDPVPFSATRAEMGVVLNDLMVQHGLGPIDFIGGAPNVAPLTVTGSSANPIGTVRFLENGARQYIGVDMTGLIPADPPNTNLPPGPGGVFGNLGLQLGIDPDYTSTIGLPKQLGDSDEMDEATPFTVYGNWLCKIMGYPVGYAQDRAREQLESREEQFVEYAFWHGELGNVPNLTGQNGYPLPNDLGIYYSNPVQALARLEQAMAEAYGTQGVIHMGRDLATLLLSEDLLIDVGGRLSTRLGTPVVAGSGYPSAQSGNYTMVGTPALFGYRSNILESTSRPGDLLDRETNDYYGLAERSYLIGADVCGMFQVRFSYIQPTGPGPVEPGELVITLGSIPSSPIPDGTDTTIIAQTNVAPVEEVELFYQINGGAWQSAGEMTQVETLQFVYNVQGDQTTTGDTVLLYAKAGTVVSNTITINVT